MEGKKQIMKLKKHNLKVPQVSNKKFKGFLVGGWLYMVPTVLPVFP